MSKKTVTLMMVVAFSFYASGLAIGQPLDPGVHITQTGAPAIGIGEQDNGSNEITLNQTGDLQNNAKLNQVGITNTGNIMRITQEAPLGGGYSENIAVAKQDGNKNFMKVEQIATSQNVDNYAGEKDGWPTGINKTGTDISTETNPLLQDGNWNWMIIKQTARGSSPDADNSVRAKQVGNGNFMKVEQENDSGRNWAGDHRGNLYEPMLQDGCCNWMDIDQETSSGDNYTLAEQRGCFNLMKIKQRAATGNTAQDSTDAYEDDPILQQGYGNKLVGASHCGAYAWVSAWKDATQIACSGSNELKSVQIGNCNEIGLYQRSCCGSNTADIRQEGNGNTLAIYQVNCGDNTLTASQIGDGLEARVVQKFSGGGVITVNQTNL